MKAFIQSSLLTLTIYSSLVMSQDFYIEDEDLNVLPQQINDVIRNSSNEDFTSCKLIGKPINLSGKSDNSGFFATTADACGWGRASGPIWVVLNGAQPDLVLESGGYSLELSGQSQNSLPNITISTGTAGISETSHWEFDGELYIEVDNETQSNMSDTSLADAYVVILGGGTSESALPPLQAKFKSSSLSQLVSLPNNAVLTLESKYINGLNPGYHIAVLGFCAQKEKAESLRDVAKRSFPGSYIRKVQVDSSQISCPTLLSSTDTE